MATAGQRTLGGPGRQHLEAVGESYWEHQRAAFSLAVTLLGAGAACLVHALLPGLFASRASSAVRSLHQRMLARGLAGADPASGSQAAAPTSSS